MAGGLGTRLSPVTQVVNKHLLPIAGKPMIYYPLTTLILAGATEICIVANEKDVPEFSKLLNNIQKLGLTITFKTQENASGIADGILLCREFLAHDEFLMILGDNIFHGPGLTENLKAMTTHKSGCCIMCYHVDDASRYGVATVVNNQVTKIQEKPEKPESNYAITGLYKFGNAAIQKALNIQPSQRGELEITDVLEEFRKDEKLSAKIIDRGFSWLDVGTFESMRDADTYITSVERHQGFLVGSPEEALFLKKRCSATELLGVINDMPISNYSKYLKKLTEKNI